MSAPLKPTQWFDTATFERVATELERGPRPSLWSDVLRRLMRERAAR